MISHLKPTMQTKTLSAMSVYIWELREIKGIKYRKFKVR